MGFFDTSAWHSQTALPTIPRCGACGLLKGCKTPKMPPTGKGKRRILFVGESPGEKEDDKGEQLIGPAGQVLQKLLKELDCDLDDCWKTNAAACRPPKNKIEDIYIESCRPLVYNAIKQLQPNVIVLLGGSAVYSLIAPEWGGNLGEVGKWVGWTIPSARYGAWLCPTYHPSYLLRSGEDPLLCKLARGHLRAALELENIKPEPLLFDELKKQVTIWTNPRHMEAIIQGYTACEELTAFDFETTGKKPERPEQRILSVSFYNQSLGCASGVVDESCHDALRRFCSNHNIRKIASNMKFETRWAAVKLQTHVASWAWDTMLAAHVEDNRGADSGNEEQERGAGICGLKFQAYVRLGVAGYEQGIRPLVKAKDANSLNRLDENTIKDSLIYGGIDSLLEYKLALLQGCK